MWASRTFCASSASFGIAAVVHDPLADPAGAAGKYGIELGARSGGDPADAGLLEPVSR